MLFGIYDNKEVLKVAILYWPIFFCLLIFLEGMLFMFMLLLLALLCVTVNVPTRTVILLFFKGVNHFIGYLPQSRVNKTQWQHNKWTDCAPNSRQYGTIAWLWRWCWAGQHLHKLLRCCCCCYCFGPHISRHLG